MRAARGCARGEHCRAASLRPLVISLLAFMLGLAAAAPSAVAATKGVRIQVTFAGEGTFTADVPVEEEDVTHVLDTLSWQSKFKAILKKDGTIVASGPGVIDEGPGGYSFEDPGMHVACKGTLPLNPAAAQPQLSSEGARLKLQALPAFGLLASPGGEFAGCVGQVEGRTFDASPVAAAYAAGFLNAYLPDVLAVSVQAPTDEEVLGKPTIAVTNADAPAQLPGSCAQLTEDPGCAMSLSWSGRVSFEAECSAKTVINCTEQQAKADAKKASKRYAAEEHEDEFVYKTNGCGKAHNRSSVGIQSGAAGACVGAELRILYDELMKHHYNSIANDPPDPRYKHVVRPHVKRIANVSALRRFSPATYKLMTRYLKIAALTGAVVESENRASGAAEAIAKGKANAGAKGETNAAIYLKRQNKAVLRYARKAVRLLRAQHGLTLRAAAQLRHIASHMHGVRSRLLAFGIRALAKSISSPEALAADKLAIRGLSFSR